MSNETRDFFVSYTEVDKEWAKWVAWTLEKAKYKVWIQEWDFRPGNNFVLKMDEALKDARRVLPILSPAFLKGAFTQPEWAKAFVGDPKGEGTKLIPIMIKECDPKGLLESVIHINLVGLSKDKARSILLKGVASGRAKPPNEPGFPGAAEPEPSAPAALPATESDSKPRAIIEDSFIPDTYFMDSELLSKAKLDLRAMGTSIATPFKCSLEVSLRDIDHRSHQSLIKEVNLTPEIERHTIAFAYSIPPVNSTRSQAFLNIRLFPKPNSPYTMGKEFYGNTYELRRSSGHAVIVEQVSQIHWI